MKIRARKHVANLSIPCIFFSVLTLGGWHSSVRPLPLPYSVKMWAAALLGWFLYRFSLQTFAVKGLERVADFTPPANETVHDNDDCRIYWKTTTMLSPGLMNTSLNVLSVSEDISFRMQLYSEFSYAFFCVVTCHFIFGYQRDNIQFDHDPSWDNAQRNEIQFWTEL